MKPRTPGYGQSRRGDNNSTGPPDTAERSPAEGSVPDEALGGGYVTASLPPAADTGLDDAAGYVADLRRRRQAAWRLPPLADGYHDPLDCLRTAS
jgi:hypothetical protein